MRFLSSRFASAALLTGAAFSFAPDAHAAQARPSPAKTGNTPSKPTVFHASQKTLETLGPALTEDMIRIAGQDTAHMILVSPSDVLNEQDREKISKISPDRPPPATLLPGVDGKSRVLSLVRSIGREYPEGYIRSLASSPKAHLNRVFGYLASGLPHAFLEKDPRGNVCFITGMDPDYSPLLFLSQMAGLKTIELADAGPARGYFSAVMKHEAKHCGHPMDRLTGRKWPDAVLELTYETEADEAAFAEPNTDEQKNVVRLQTHARNVGLIRTIKSLDLVRGAPHHAAPVIGADGKKILPRNMILASMLLNNLIGSVNGISLARPEVILDPNPPVQNALERMKMDRLPHPKILKAVREKSFQFGTILNTLDPVIEYAGMRYVEAKLLEISAGKTLLPFEDAMLRIARGYIEGMEALNPSFKTHPGAMAHIDSIRSLPPRFWEDVSGILSLPEFDELEKTGKEPGDHILQIVGGLLGQSPAAPSAPGRHPHGRHGPRP